MSFEDWARRHPQAAADLIQTLNGMPWPMPEEAAGKSEAWAQQNQRFLIARGGGMSWRNNVGATPAKCPECNAPHQPIRFGLANDSAKLNEKIKSSDLIFAVPRKIRPQDVGTTIAQFGGMECKPPGWKYTGKGREPAQAAWLALINKLGGFACFTTGSVEV